MSGEEHKAVVRRAIEELFNTGSLEVADEVFAADYVDHTPSNSELSGLENIKRFVCEWRIAFSNTRNAIDDMVAEGDRVAVRWTTYATHEGEFLGVSPTGHKVTVRWLGIFRVMEGKIVESWDHYETQGLLHQLGAGLLK